MSKLATATRCEQLWEAFSLIYEDLIRISEDQFNDMTISVNDVNSSNGNIDGARMDFQINITDLREMSKTAKQSLEDLKSDKDFDNFVADWKDEFDKNENIFNHYTEFIEQLCKAQERIMEVFVEELLKCSNSIEEINKL